MSDGFSGTTQGFSDSPSGGGGGLGDVVGPASSTDNALTRFDLGTGKLVQNSGVTLDDNDLMVFDNTTADINIGEQQQGTAAIYNTIESTVGANSKLIASISDTFKTGVHGVTYNVSETGTIQYWQTISAETTGAFPSAVDVGIKQSYVIATGGSTMTFVTSAGSSYTATDDGSSNVSIQISPLGTGVLNFANTPAYATDTAAGVGGLVTGDIYHTVATAATADIAIGDLLIKQKA